MDSPHGSRPSTGSRLEDFAGEVLHVERGRAARSRVVDEPAHGYAAVLEDRGWIVARIEARSECGLRELVAAAFHLPVADLVRPMASQRVAAAAAALREFAHPVLESGARPPSRDRSLETDLHRLLLRLVQAAAADGVGVGLLVDDAGELCAADLATVAALSARAEEHRWPLQIVLAGLRT